MQHQAHNPMGMPEQASNVQDPHAGEATAIRVMQRGSMLMPLMFMGGMASAAVAFVAGGAVGLVNKSAGNSVKSWIKAPFEALHMTSVSNFRDYGKNFTQVRQVIAEHGKVPDDFAKSIMGSASKATGAISHSNGPISRMLDALDRSAPMRTITDSVSNFAGKREASLLARGTEKSIAKAEGWASMKNMKGFGNFIKGLPGKFKGGSMFGAIAITGAAMASGAMLLSNHRANREDNEALREFAGDIYGVAPGAVSKDMLHGVHAHPLVAEAKKIYDKNSHGRILMNVFGLAGDALMANNIGGTASVSLMAAEMGLPAIGGMLATENPTLSVYDALKKADAGQFQLADDQKVRAVAQLLTAVPAVAHNGGADNAYVMPVAETIVSRGMKAPQILQTIADPVKFQKLSQEVVSKIQQEQAAAAAQAQASTQTETAEKIEKKEHVAHASQPTMHHAAAPSLVGQIHHEGMVTGHQAQAARIH